MSTVLINKGSVSKSNLIGSFFQDKILTSFQFLRTLLYKKARLVILHYFSLNINNWREKI
jgi:hypothetical protein